MPLYDKMQLILLGWEDMHMNALYKRIVTIGMISVTALLAWVYCIIAYHDKSVYVVGTSLVLVVSIYIFLNALIDLHLAKQENMQKYISDLVASSLTNSKTDTDVLERLGKASYIQLRKSADSLSRLSDLDAETKQLITDTINKAAKVIIKYNELNNEKLVDAIDTLNTNIENLNGIVALIQMETSEANKTVSTLSKIPNLDDIFVEDEPISKTTTNTPVDEISTDDLFSEDLFADDSINEKTDTIEDKVIEEPFAEEMISEEPVTQETISEETSTDDVIPDIPSTDDVIPNIPGMDNDTNKKLSDEEITALFEASKEAYRANSDDDFHVLDHPETLDQNLVSALLGMLDESDRAAEEAGSTEDTNATEDAGVSEIADVIPFPSAEPDLSSEVSSNEASLSEASSDNFLNSSGLLSQDAIDMLLQGNNKTEEATEEEIPSPITPSVTPSPTSDDSNRQLSQEEIAALFASMQG